VHNAPPPDLDLVALSDAIRIGWGVDKFELQYLPVGGGAYHWHLTGSSDSLFVTVDDLDDKDWLGAVRDTVAEMLAQEVAFENVWRIHPTWPQRSQLTGRARRNPCQAI